MYNIMDGLVLFLQGNAGNVYFKLILKCFIYLSGNPNLSSTHDIEASFSLFLKTDKIKLTKFVIKSSDQASFVLSNRRQNNKFSVVKN